MRSSKRERSWVDRYSHEKPVLIPVAIHDLGPTQLTTALREVEPNSTPLGNVGGVHPLTHTQVHPDSRFPRTPAIYHPLHLDAGFSPSGWLAVILIFVLARVFAEGTLMISKGRYDMAIAVKLDDLLHDRRMTLTELAEKVDITLANLSILKTGKARAIRFSTLEAICAALGCQPGDLLEFRHDTAANEHPRAA